MDESDTTLEQTSSTATTDENEILEIRPCSSCELLDPPECASKTNLFFCCKKKIKEISECWLISIPKTEGLWDTLNEKTGRNNLSQNYKFHIPDLNIGSLNDLMASIPLLKTNDIFVREVTVLLCECIRQELQHEGTAVNENLKVNDLTPLKYLTRFKWNESKYPISNSVSETIDQIWPKVYDIREELKEKGSKLLDAKSSLELYEQKRKGHLRYRYLGNIVKKEHLIESKFLLTLLVIVPNKKEKQWLKQYPTFCGTVLPNSSKKIFHDATHSLFNVIIRKKDQEEFVKNAAKQNFIVRDYEYSEHSEEIGLREVLDEAKEKELCQFLSFAKSSFEECFEAWIHIKALRVYVDSVLRFSSNLSFRDSVECMLLIPLNSKKRLRKLINRLYEKLDVSLARGSVPDLPTILNEYDVEEYYTYVFFKVDIGFLHKRSQAIFENVYDA